MKKPLFTGSGTALITPFDKENHINYPKLKELIEMQIKGHTDALIICGTTGESPSLEEREHIQIVEKTVEYTRGRIPVIAGAGSNNTKHACFLAKEAKKAGADGLLVVTPYYNKTSQEGLIAHYYTIAEQTDLPIIVYHIPGRTGVTIQPETMQKLAKHPNIIAIKEASGDISMVAKIRALCGDEFAVYSGNDDQIVPILSLGGSGVISVLSNIMPKETHDLCQYFFDGKVKESATLQLKLLKLIHALFIDVNPIPVKEALNLMGFAVGDCRLPLYPLNQARKEILISALKEQDLLS